MSIVELIAGVWFVIAITTVLIAIVNINSEKYSSICMRIMFLHLALMPVGMFYLMVSCFVKSLSLG